MPRELLCFRTEFDGFVQPAHPSPTGYQSSSAEKKILAHTIQHFQWDAEQQLMATISGAEHFAIIRSHLDTLHKQGSNLLNALRLTFLGKPPLPAMC